MKSQHGPKNLKCLKCEMAFRSMGDLKDHLISHFNWKPYSCSDCGFSQKIPLRVKNHIKRMHPNSATVVVKTNESDLKDMTKMVNDEAEVILLSSKSNMD